MALAKTEEMKVKELCVRAKGKNRDGMIKRKRENRIRTGWKKKNDEKGEELK